MVVGVDVQVVSPSEQLSGGLCERLPVDPEVVVEVEVEKACDLCVDVLFCDRCSVAKDVEWVCGCWVGVAVETELQCA